MVKHSEDGLTQVIMARMADVVPATISRFISKNSIAPLESNGKRNIRYSIDKSRDIISAIKEKKTISQKCHAFYNFKGGTGKTSLCYQVSTHVALMGYRVLVIDTDPQAHLTSSFNIIGFEQRETLYDCIVRQKDIDEIVTDVFPGCQIIPSNLSLTRLEPELNNMARREERLDIVLGGIKEKYDFIFIDTNPTISILNRNVIVTSDCLDVVAETQPFSLMGLKYLMEDIEKFYSQMQLKPRRLNIIPNKYEDRSSNSAEAMSILRKYYGKYIKEDFAIRRSEDIINSSKISKPVSLFAKKNSIAVEDVLELVKYIIITSQENYYAKDQI